MKWWFAIGLLSTLGALVAVLAMTPVVSGEAVPLQVELGEDGEDVDLGFVGRGETRALDVPVRNTGSVPLNIRGEVLEITGEASRWVTIVPDRLTVGPGERAVVQVSVSPPQDIKPRRVATRISFREESGTADPVGLRLKYHVPGIRLDIVSRDSDVGEIAAAVVVIGNYGPDAVEFALDVVLRGGNGVTRDLLEDAPGLIAPNAVERLEVLIDTTGLEVGSYQVEASAKPFSSSDGSDVVLAQGLQMLFVGVLKGEVIEAAPRVVVGQESMMEYRAVVRNTGNRPLVVALTGLLHDAQGHARGEGVKSATVPIGETREVILSLPVHQPSAGMRPGALLEVLRGSRYTLDAIIAIGGQTQQKTDVVVVPAPMGAKLITLAGGIAVIGLIAGGAFLARRPRGRRAVEEF